MKIELNPADFGPVIEAAVNAAVDRLRAEMADEILTEEEAARLVKLPCHVLRDLRLRGEIQAAKFGRQARYSRRAINDYILGRNAQEKPRLKVAR